MEPARLHEHFLDHDIEVNRMRALALLSTIGLVGPIVRARQTLAPVPAPARDERTLAIIGRAVVDFVKAQP